MTRTAIGGGVYQSPDGKYWARPWIHRRRTWRLLVDDRKTPVTTRRAAFKAAGAADWSATADTFPALSKLYLQAGCPNKRLEPRGRDFCNGEAKKIAHLDLFFAKHDAAEIRLTHIPQYAAFRMRRCQRGTGERAVDKDQVTLSNVLNYGVAIGKLEINYIRAGRPRYRREDKIRHSRDVAPADAGIIHRIADELFSDLRGEVLAWQALFALFTGCRTSELLRLRRDAKGDHAGALEWLPEPAHAADGAIVLGYLHLQRSKAGVNPWAIIGPEFAQCLECFGHWHRKRFHDRAKHYFPSPAAEGTVSPGALGHAIVRILKDLNAQIRKPKDRIRHITPHGIRSYYVTKRRSDGARDPQIAAEIGDKTVTLMSTSYGDRPPNWYGSKQLTWLPAEALPAWLRWQSAARKVVKIGNRG